MRRGRQAQLFLRPRFLCFIDESDGTSYTTWNVADYIDEHGDHVDTEFVFVSYTRLQFRVATEEEIDNFDFPDEEARKSTAPSRERIGKRSSDGESKRPGRRESRRSGWTLNAYEMPTGSPGPEAAATMSTASAT